VRYLVLAALLVITAINYVQRNAIGPAETTIRADLAVTREQTGDAISAFFLGYLLLQVPSGWLATRIGPRLALSLYAVAWSVATGVCGLVSGVGELYVARLIMGAAQAGIFPCCTLILASWYPPSLRGTATAALTSFMLIGGAVCTPLTGFLLEPVGWRWVFGLYMLPGLMWGMWFLVWFRGHPREKASVNKAELAVIAEGRPGYLEPEDRAGAAVPRSAIPWAAILLSSSLLMVYTQQAFRAGANRFYDNYLPTYYQEERGASVELAGLLTSLPLWAGVVGSMVGGALSDVVLRRTGSRGAARKGVAIGSLVAGSLCFLAAYPVGNVWASTILFSLGVFVTTFASPCAYALAMDISGKQLAIVFGFMNMAGNFGAYAFTWGLPRLVSLGGWDLALAAFVGAHVAAALCWLPVRAEGNVGEPPRKQE
jgi:ACS family glucarate transporter-like MFS transporter